MAGFDATKGAKIGMDEADLTTWVEKTMKGAWRATMGTDRKAQEATWLPLWSEVVLFQSPQWATDLPAYSLSKFEVTNAQWEHFLREARTDEYVTKEGDTLAGVAAAIWRITNPDKAQAEITRGWKILLSTNGDVLQPVLNPKNEPKWEADVARAQEQAAPPDEYGCRADQ